MSTQAKKDWTPELFVEIEVHERYGEWHWAQAKYLVHATEDVLWTDDVDAALAFLKKDLEAKSQADPLTTIRAECLAELERIEKHGGCTGFASRMLALIEDCDSVMADLLAACELLVEAERAATDEANFELLVQATEAAEAAIARAREEKE